MIDWNGDGKPDLLLGFISGKAKLVINKGNMVFGEAQDLLVGGKALEGNKLRPTVADWDGDGTLDLIVGYEEGRITFFKGAKGDTGYTFAAGQNLIENYTLPAPKRPHSRPTPTVVDWNGDGKLDLLVGDFTSEQSEPKGMTAAQIKKREKLEKEQMPLIQIFTGIQSKVMNALMVKEGYKDYKDIPTDKQQAFFKKVQTECEKDKEYVKATKRYAETNKELSPLRATYSTNGYVWIYLRK